jgi:hypothetical protein
MQIFVSFICFFLSFFLSFTYCSGEAPQSQTSVLARMFAAGYTLGEGARDKARAIDERHSFLLKARVAGEAAKAHVNELDRKLHVSETAAKVGEAVKTQYAKVDEKLHINDKAREAKNQAVTMAQVVHQAAMSNSVVAGGVDMITQAKDALMGKVNEVKADTRRAIDEKKAASGNPYPSAPAPEGDEAAGAEAEAAPEAAAEAAAAPAPEAAPEAAAEQPAE